ncbi:unnamed protein product [Angiostrongylus costaricensis]|uniref:SDR family oxidoreductase n=1 Tax=Angiostrongylus costaricensis TaxID=334426 RepID=A0A0R3PDS3_ANGCS|nr:unnamed protein product [Angiostrongylus costaricensis]
MTSCRRLEGKVAIVTASTKGIGLAIAERLCLEGAAVVISSRNQKNVDDALEYLRSKGCSKVSWLHFRNLLLGRGLEKFDKIDILINNHGISPVIGHILGGWDKLFKVNVKAGWQLSKLVYPYMAKNGGGSIVFNSSLSAYSPPPQGIAAYAVTKTALLGLTKALANGLAKDNIRVNAIAPGIIRTRMSKMNSPFENRLSLGITNRNIPLTGEPKDCAGAVAFLVSDDAKHITGETIVIAGGVHARL